ncbi:MAG TPA: hypothetical protein DCZ92_12055 [Elusimicrobia bacterium]|nr:MAG: hypothetical protein A2016_11260 [Elusimicrobia bacterium GWF2_62_30]HBA61524.1 hypothetical protein [Elusimicrobiota bacterium]
MKHLSLLILILSLAPAAQSADQGLKCQDIRPKIRSVKVSRMQPLKRGDNWLEGSAKNVHSQSCDLYGMKTEEAEYDGKTLLLKTVYEYHEKEAAKKLCETLRSEEKITTTFSGEGRSSLDEFCRRNKKKDFGVVLVYDATPSQGRETTRKPIRQIFRLYNGKGFVTEEHAFDPTMNLETVTLYVYDKGNNLTETTVNDFDGRQLRRETAAWNKPTRSRTVSEFGENNELRRKAIYEQREDGTLRREVRTTHDSGEQVVSKSEVYCDEKGRYQKELVYDADSPEPAYEFTYVLKFDDKGNWTEERKAKVIVYNGNRMPDKQHAPELTKREILYY